MVTRKRLRSFFTALGLYAAAAFFVGYFAINTYSGSRGLRAQQALEQRIVTLTDEVDRARQQRTYWERRVALLRSDRIDPDLLDERARADLQYIDPHEVMLLLKPQ